MANEPKSKKKIADVLLNGEAPKGAIQTLPDAASGMKTLIEDR